MINMLDLDEHERIAPIHNKCNKIRKSAQTVKGKLHRGPQICLDIIYYTSVFNMLYEKLSIG
jgi:hypothetical protein